VSKTVTREQLPMGRAIAHASASVLYRLWTPLAGAHEDRRSLPGRYEVWRQ
jgi:hypothetical protein